MCVLCVASEVSFSVVCGVVWCVLVWCEKESIVCLYAPFLYVKLPVSNDKWSHDLSSMLQYLYEVQ